MNPLLELRATAFANAQRVVDSRRRFPKNVFVGRWAHFRFFDSDWMFAPDFVVILRQFLRDEGSACACVLRLDPVVGEGIERMFFVDGQTTPEAYGEVFMHESGGWFTDYGRFGCTSNRGEWCFYCERGEGIGVAALRAPDALTRYASAFALLPTSAIDEAVREPLIYGIGTMPDSWKLEMPRAYSKRLR
jgi:hypothetical protein